MTTDNFQNVEEEWHGLPVGAPVNLVDWHSEETIGEMPSSLIKNAHKHGSMSVLAQNSRRRVLELGLLLSIIVTVICAALWLSGIFTQDTGPHITNTSPSTIKKGIQAFSTQTTNGPLTQPSAQASVPTTDVATVLPSAQRTITSIAQPTVSVKSTSIAQSPSSTPTPTPTPTPTSYEGESSQNTLGGDATIDNCSGCSGGKRVGNVGQSGTLQFNNVNESSAGNYTLAIYYTDGDAGRSLSISANGGGGVNLSFHGTNDGNWSTPQSISITVNLNAGQNTIKFYNSSARGPDIDRIVV